MDDQCLINLEPRSSVGRMLNTTTQWRMCLLFALVSLYSRDACSSRNLQQNFILKQTVIKIMNEMLIVGDIHYIYLPVLCCIAKQHSLQKNSSSRNYVDQDCA